MLSMGVVGIHKHLSLELYLLDPLSDLYLLLICEISELHLRLLGICSQIDISDT